MKNLLFVVLLALASCGPVLDGPAPMRPLYSPAYPHLQQGIPCGQGASQFSAMCDYNVYTGRLTVMSRRYGNGVVRHNEWALRQYLRRNNNPNN